LGVGRRCSSHLRGSCSFPICLPNCSFFNKHEIFPVHFELAMHANILSQVVGYHILESAHSRRLLSSDCPFSTRSQHTFSAHHLSTPPLMCVHVIVTYRLCTCLRTLVFSPCYFYSYAQPCFTNKSIWQTVEGRCLKCAQLYRAAELVAIDQDFDIVINPCVFGDQPPRQGEILPGPMSRSRPYGGALMYLKALGKGDLGARGL
jgi:hypothetical protein